MWFLENNAEVLSAHLTLDGARNALRQYNSTDKSGRIASIKKMPLVDILYAIGCILLAAGIGTILAWRG